MKHTTLGHAIAVSAVALFFANQAVAEEGYYFEMHGGGAFLTDSDFDVSGGGGGEVEFDTGYLIGGAFGYAFEQGFRTEIAIDYRHNDIDKISGGGGSASGDMDALSGMINGYFQLPVDFPVKPYVGAGIGAANIDTEARAFGTSIVDDDDTVFAYQAMAGLTFEINPAVAIGAGYIYFATQDPEFETKGGTDFDGEYASHNFMVQVRFSTYPTGAF